jgi:DNA-binding transcriptional LysR family regulator
MDLRHLRYFVAVAEEGHVTRAAERLGIQQPPLSQQIRALETELDVLLFRRKPRGVELTDAGESFLVDARRILADVDTALAKVQRTARGEQGRIVVGFTSSAPFHPFLPGVLRSYRERYPLVSMVLEEAGTGDLVSALTSERLDAAFIRSPVQTGDGITVHDLLEERMLAALPSDHRLAAEVEDLPIDLADLADEPFILYRRASGPGLYDALVGACHRAGFMPRIEQEAPRIVATLNLVAAGFGVTIVPESLCTMHLDGVAYRPIGGTAQLAAPISLACRTTDHSQAARRFVELVRKAARDGR